MKISPASVKYITIYTHTYAHLPEKKKNTAIEQMKPAVITIKEKEKKKLK